MSNIHYYSMAHSPQQKNVHIEFTKLLIEQFKKNIDVGQESFHEIIVNWVKANAESFQYVVSVYNHNVLVLFSDDDGNIIGEVRFSTNQNLIQQECATQPLRINYDLSVRISLQAAIGRLIQRIYTNLESSSEAGMLTTDRYELLVRLLTHYRSDHFYLTHCTNTNNTVTVTVMPYDTLNGDSIVITVPYGEDL